MCQNEDIMSSEVGFDLKAFLDSQEKQGTVDSEGAFTVVRDTALKKLASFALPGKADWVLKVVQAVNIWNAPKLVVRQTRIATSFYFCPPAGKDFPSEAKIVGALEATSLDGHDPVHQLAMALRSLVQQVGLGFVLAIRENGQMGKPVFAGDDVGHLSSSSRNKWGALDLDGVRLTVSHFKGRESITGRYLPTLSFQSRRDVEILSILEKRCFASPVPIDLDGRIISNPYPGSSSYVAFNFRPLVVGRLDSAASSVVSDSVISAQHPRQSLVVCSKFDDAKQPWFYVSAPDWKLVSEVYSLLASGASSGSKGNYRLKSGFYWLRHGVIVSARELTGFVGNDIQCSVFFCADELRSDLSGLQIDLDDCPEAMKSACYTLASFLEEQLDDQKFCQELVAASTVSANPSREDKVETELAGTEEGVLTGSIVPGMPTVGLGLLKVVDSLAEKLLYLPTYDKVLIKWRNATLQLARALCRELRAVDIKGSSRVVNL